MEFLLIGQPNCGKSTIFNEVIGYKSIASNFPGVTVTYTKGEIILHNGKFNIIDLPGTYSLVPSDDAEKATITYLYSKYNEDNVIINICDASVLSRSLELTLQLMELQKPMILVLNMIDEAKRKGININTEKLSDLLGIPVITSIGREGVGIYEIFDTAYKLSKEKKVPKIIEGPADVEKIINQVENRLENIDLQFNKRFAAIKLIEKDEIFVKLIDDKLAETEMSDINSMIKKLESIPNKDSSFIISSVRHNMSFNIFEKVAIVNRNVKRDIRDLIDNILLHPILGHLFLILILYLSFQIVFWFGGLIEPFFGDFFEIIGNYLQTNFKHNPLIYHSLNGLVQGVGGGIMIVIPYLFPFFIILSLLEDTGYLARVAYMVDNIMHKIGLHGTSIFPMIMGYGCTVPGILATRILKSDRDKFITATLTTLVPCSARLTVILGLVGFYISGQAAILIYILNIVIIGITGKFLSKVMPEVSPGLILEIPKYHLPSIKSLLSKTWFRLKDFVYMAWPLLIIGSIIMEIISYYKWDNTINAILKPLTVQLLGLPVAVGTVLLFGIMRKELALIMLFSALGTNKIAQVMTTTQIMTFTMFVTFYIPCLATIGALSRELKWKKAGIVMLLTFSLAIIISFMTRIFYSLF